MSSPKEYPKRNKKRGQALRAWRKHKGITPKELAKIMGVSEQTIRNYENGESWQQIDNLQSLCNALELNINCLSNIDKNFCSLNIKIEARDTESTYKSSLQRIRNLTHTNDYETLSLQDSSISDCSED